MTFAFQEVSLVALLVMSGVQLLETFIKRFQSSECTGEHHQVKINMKDEPHCNNEKEKE